MTPTERAKRRYTCGVSNFALKEKKKPQQELRGIWDENNELIGHVSLKKNSDGHLLFPPKIEINGRWYVLAERRKWDE